MRLWDVMSIDKVFHIVLIKNFLFSERNRQLIFSPKIPYNLVAEQSEANRNRLQIPYWCCILELVRTHFAACGGEEPIQ